MSVSDQTHRYSEKSAEKRLSRPAGLSPQAAGTASRQQDASPRRGAFSGRLRRYWPLFVLGLAIGAGLAAYYWGARRQGPGQATQLASAPIPPAYSPDRAIGYLREIVDIGPRPTGSEGMLQQQAYLTEFFTKQGAKVSLQKENIRHPLTGESVEMANLIAAWYPERPIRFLLCAHYDTRPFPDRDRKDPKGVFVGANDGASGVAAWMEMSHHFTDLPEDVGVDVVLFDAEEFVFEEGRDDYFLGSIFFAQQYRMSPPEVPYRAGVLLDMVGDRELQLIYDRASLRYARDVTKSIWRTAAKLGVSAFVPRTRMQELRDDHLPLNQIAKIPTTDLIDFDYPRPGFRAPQYWHTTEDTADKCSGSSLAAVTWVVHQWIVEQSEIAD
ncbi:M28 family peptidase [Allorhodopirellula solitaria]|uniref:Peptidase family M28 n=1 Tax=Allorhodopirellula solitaria TaxID=2527987 RepID=A0A5C5X0K1_9BACT|nr:M28 family peptidase [Allorhodopirellula solitaria]TWT56517.1 Peptidase family M28 [Allorhodopirellula solitaria]